MISPGNAPDAQAKSEVWITFVARCDGDGLNGSSGDSLSVTIRFVAPLLKPAALAVTATTCALSISGSSTMLRLNAAEVCPARIVVLAATASSVRSLDTNATGRFVINVPLIRTVPALVSVPFPSRAENGNVTLSTVGSLSLTVTLAKPSVQLTTRAVSDTGCGPSICESLMTVT